MKLTSKEQKTAAKKFAKNWENRGYEKGDTQPFWYSLLGNVYGIEYPENFISFEDQVHLDNTSFMDGYIDSTKVLIEQKGLVKDLTKEIKQSDGSYLTPFQQAKRYITELPLSKHPRYVITCNFSTFHIYDMEDPQGEPEILKLKNLEKEYYRLLFLVEEQKKMIKKEEEISIKAGEMVGKLYDALLKQYKDPNDENSLKSLNILCVRLVFCLYAEDAGIFDEKQMFYNYLINFDASHIRRELIELFKVLDTPIEKRDPYIEEKLNQFPYVNGGLFEDENIEIPQFNEKIKDLLLNEASKEVDWSDISPTIFGAVFESTLNPETRHSGGMHYTSVENIHKVIDPLFLDDLKEEFEEIKKNTNHQSRDKALDKFQDKLASLNFLDPACGSGNFLTETYLSLRRIENGILKLKQYKNNVKGQIIIGMAKNPIRVSIDQFYGIEINDFAVTVAKTALWIAESQMMKETEDIVHMPLDFLPLKTNAYIVEGNALTMDWGEVVPKYQLNYIIGNPPFLGGMNMSITQKEEIKKIFEGVKGSGEFDYVTGWYKKAAEFIFQSQICCAFVSTNSICQGSQVITFWKHIIEKYKIYINFAYTTFVWDNKTKDQAKVHCVIVGFSLINNKNNKLFSNEKKYKLCKQISPYLTDTSTIFIESRNTPICNVPKMRFGSMPRDGGGLVLSKEDKKLLIENEPLTKKWIKPYIGASEFLHNKERYCLWLVDAEPSEINKCPTVKKRIELVREIRASSKAKGTQKFADTPTLFCQIAQPNTAYIIVPKTSSGNRKYIPLGFQDKDTIASDLVFLIPNAGLYEFGVLMSNVHNWWMRLVAGRLKSDYRYSKDIVYNNFPWPTLTDEQKEKIRQTAQGILDARNLYPESSLADLYNRNTMPVELLKAHQNNDRTVMKAYGLSVKNTTEESCVAFLMKLYQKIVGTK